MASAVASLLRDDDGFEYTTVPEIPSEWGFTSAKNSKISDDNLGKEVIPTFPDDDDDDDIAALVQNLMKKGATSASVSRGESRGDERRGGEERGGLSTADNTALPSPPAYTATTERIGTSNGPVTKSRVEEIPPVADDYVRNFLLRVGMLRTLDCFNTEWYELKARGLLPPEDVLAVPDVYAQNERLNETVNRLRIELGHAQEVAAKAQGTWEKLRKERDFHRMHHKRIAQEKNKLVDDMKRLKTHFESFEPTVRELKGKYEAAIREKMLAKVERDKLVAKVSGLEAQLKAMGVEAPLTDSAALPQGSIPAAPPSRTNATSRRHAALPSSKGSSRSPTRASAGQRTRGAGGLGGTTLGRIPENGTKQAPLPEEMENPYLKLAFEPAHAAEYGEQGEIKAHSGAISGAVFHPTKPVLATVSDDMTWRLWAMPDAELVMTGEGHRAWLADVDFHPAGTHLATCSGDGIIKLWDLTTASCAATFTDHTQTTWSVAFHQAGDFLLSASMDHTCRLFDIHSGKVRQTLRGHVDSVNAIAWQPFSINVATGSGDKTVSIWDIRSGLCVQTFYGHTNAVNDVVFNLAGDSVASCDADGVVRLWDIRMVAERASASIGRIPIHAVCFDRSAHVLAAGCDDGQVRIFDASVASAPATGPSLKAPVANMKVINTLRGHKDSVQTVAFDPTSSYLISAGNDATVRMWAENALSAPPSPSSSS